MIARMIWRALVVLVAFGVSVCVALVVLFTLGAMWVGQELQAAAPDDPLFRQGGAVAFGAVFFSGAVAPALTGLPAVLAAVAGEVLRVRSWIYYVLAGGGAVVAIPLLVGTGVADGTAAPAGEYVTIFATAGFAGGFIYWLLAGRGA